MPILFFGPLRHLSIAAGNLCRSYRLRAYDAVQLACVLLLSQEMQTDGISTPIFVCADNKLGSFAVAEGLNVENPNNYL